jgi:hypothetical protein
MLTNEVHPLRTTLEISDWKETPVNIDRVGIVPLFEAFRDIVPKEHLIGQASLPLCCETTFTSIMSRSSIRIDCGMKLTKSSKPIPLFFRIIFKELKQTRGLFTDGSKSAKGPFGGFSVFNYYEDKGWSYKMSQIAPYLPWRA